MSERKIVFNDGEAYERFMGKWSLLAGEVYLDWIAPKAGLRWVDVGCGNGAFTELLLERAGAAKVEGVDPSDGQLHFARKRLSGRKATFRTGDAIDLPFADGTFDAAVMALVLFFVPEPEKSVEEMVRVAKPGATIGAYVWDVFGGGFPTVPMTEELQAFGVQPLRPPRSDISGLDALKAIWEGAGLRAVKTRTIDVERVFDSFDDWWESCRGASSLAATIDCMSPRDLAKLRDATRRRLASVRMGSSAAGREPTRWQASRRNNGAHWTSAGISPLCAQSRSPRMNSPFPYTGYGHRECQRAAVGPNWTPTTIGAGGYRYV